MTRVLTTLLAGVMLLTATGCANMTARQRNTAIGAGVGGLAGAALIGGPGQPWAVPHSVAWSAT